MRPEREAWCADAPAGDAPRRVVVAKLGLDGHDRGVKVVARMLRDAGMEVVHLGLRQTPERVVQAALQEDADAVAVSIHEGGHLTLAPRLVASLREARLDIPVIVGGVVPEPDVHVLRAAGVAAVLGPGASAGEVVGALRDAPGRSVGDEHELRVLAPAELFERAREGDQRAVARLASVVERGGAAADAVDAVTIGRAGGAHVIGVTGAPGVGKSTLVGRLATHASEVGHRPAVVATDPSSPTSHGAILGDRLRMREMDPALFVRSMAARGHAGGLALALPAVVRVLDAAGFGVVIVETVGVGPGQVDVADVADTTVVVVAPRWGDSVQASKAGLLELADIFVVNQADRGGAVEAQHDLESMLELGGSDAHRRVPVVLTDALADVGTAELWDAICAHRAVLARSSDDVG